MTLQTPQVPIPASEAPEIRENGEIGLLTEPEDAYDPAWQSKNNYVPIRN